MLTTLFLAVVILACIGIVMAPRLGWHLDVIYGRSMEPAMKSGSLVVIQTVEPKSVGVDDVITYRSGTDSNMVTTHRVIEVVNDGSLSFRTKGDANEDPDDYAVPAENVVGGVWMSIPHVGNGIDFIRNSLGLELFIGILAALIIGMELRNVFRSIRNLRRKRYVRQASK